MDDIVNKPPTGQQNVRPLVRVRNLKMHFPVREGWFRKVVNAVKAVDDISFDIFKGETLALVGESGCGKTTAGRCLLHLLTPTDGSIEFDGHQLDTMVRNQLRRLRPRMQIVFQDPFGSLNPRMTVGQALGEPLRVHRIVPEDAIPKRVSETLERVGLSSSFRDRYPHEFSGGQRQRISIARALVHDPDFIMCDEAVSALDASVQAQVINLLKELQSDLGLTYLFISHDLNVVRYIADRVAVMYLGKIVELAGTAELFASPKHPYTQALLSANPVPDPSVPMKTVVLEGDVPSPINVPPGCAFHQRCPKTFAPCDQAVPEPLYLAEGAPTQTSMVRCHLYTTDSANTA